MFNKLGTRTLVIVAAVLGLIWFLADRFGTGSQQRTFRSEILRLDTAAVSRIRISSRVTAHKPVLLERTGAQEWLVKYEGTEHRGSHATIQRLLSELRSLDADRIREPVQHSLDSLAARTRKGEDLRLGRALELGGELLHVGRVERVDLVQADYFDLVGKPRAIGF